MTKEFKGFSKEVKESADNEVLTSLFEKCLFRQQEVDKSITHNGKYDPVIASYAEYMELLDHLGLVATWRKNDAHMSQAFLELVDVFAFTMSDMLNFEDTYKDKELALAMTLISAGSVSKQVFVRTTEDPIRVPLDLIDEFFGHCSQGVFLSTHRMDLIFEICQVTFSMELEDLFKMYLAKTILTQFRQKNGYKDGTYVKTWFKEEDNEHLYRLVVEGTSLEDLPEKLQYIYDLVIKQNNKTGEK